MYEKKTFSKGEKMYGEKAFSKGEIMHGEKTFSKGEKMYGEKTSTKNQIFSGEQCAKQQATVDISPSGMPFDKHDPAPSITTDENHATALSGTTGSNGSTPNGTKGSDAFSFDVIIIGAGAVGCATARELSEKGLSVAVLEKEADVAFGSSGRNSGVVHAGFNNRPGSLMAKLCVQGCEDFEKEAGLLGVPFRRTGKYVLAFSDKDIDTLDTLLENGTGNGVKGLKIIRGQQLKRIFPDLSVTDLRKIKAALWSPMTGIFDPFRYNIALAEDAKQKGTEFFFLHEAESINRIENEQESATGQADANFHVGQADTDNHTQQVNTDFHMGQVRTEFLVKTNCGSGQYDFRCRFLINSAGLSSDSVCRMLGICDYSISPCRGEYHILSRNACKNPFADPHMRIPRDIDFPVYGRGIEVPLYPAPNFSEGGLGVHLTPTIDGNIMIGPGSEYLDNSDPYGMIDKSKDFRNSGETSQYSNDSGENYATTKQMMDSLLDEGLKLLSIVSDPKSSDNDSCSANPDPSTNSKPITKDDIIKSFSGIRPKLTSKEKGGFADFIIENKDGFIILTGIESPGLTASIPIAKMVSAMVDDIIAGSSSGTSTEQNDFCSSEMETADPSKTQDTPCEAETSPLNSRKDSKICGSGEPGSTRIICSCEQKTEADILKAYDSIIALGAVPTFKGLKNRTRIGMGNCQGSFCLVNTIELLEKKRGIDPLTFDNLFSGRVR